MSGQSNGVNTTVVDVKSRGRNRLKPGETRVVVSFTEEQWIAVKRVQCERFAAKGYHGEMPDVSELVVEALASLSAKKKA
jgi:hypothetical protein